MALYYKLSFGQNRNIFSKESSRTKKWSFHGVFETIIDTDANILNAVPGIAVNQFCNINADSYTIDNVNISSFETMVLIGATGNFSIASVYPFPSLIETFFFGTSKANAVYNNISEFLTGMTFSYPLDYFAFVDPMKIQLLKKCFLDMRESFLHAFIDVSVRDNTNDITDYPALVNSHLPAGMTYVQSIKTYKIFIEGTYE